MAYCFISDLHLQESRPDITKAFLEFLDDTASKAEKLYILGDLFEAWIGDDDQNNFISEIQAALLKTNKTTKIFFLHGNRDFLIGTKFASSSGFELLHDPTIEEMFGNNVLLMHGDLLCTEDHDYQAFRKTSRDPKWQDEFLNKSIQERQEIALNLRTISKEATEIKKDEIMDVSTTEVIRIMEESSVNLLIHGHTHRPKSHNIKVNDQPAERIVLGDWDKKYWYIRLEGEEVSLLSGEIT